ncbi:MAG: hypothetical protein IKB14_05470 [Rikenellaceae bacterium]|nr:hypothetical protein [Rikenellaceae bacterium]MBR3800998.1 hypothetical protein [Rikenellaceae bacterium]
MTPADYISINGALSVPTTSIDTFERLRAGYVRQDMRVRDRRPLHVAAHLALLGRAFERVYGRRVVLSPAMVAAWCADLLARNRYPASGSCRVSALLIPTERGADLVLVGGEILLDESYTIRPVRPSASVDCYNVGFGELPTSAAFEAAETALMRARNRLKVQGSHVVLRTDDEGVILSTGTAPLFAVVDHTIFTTPLVYGAPDTVERQLTLDAIVREGIDVREDIVSVGALDRYDELFYADYRGLTSIEQIESTNYMSLAVDRIVRSMR